MTTENGNNGNEQKDNGTEIYDNLVNVAIGKITRDNDNEKRSYIHATMKKISIWITTKSPFSKWGCVDVSYHKIDNLKSIHVKTKTMTIEGIKHKKLNVYVDGEKVSELTFFETRRL